jgi:hypothetical protein
VSCAPGQLPPRANATILNIFSLSRPEYAHFSKLGSLTDLNYNSCNPHLPRIMVHEVARSGGFDGSRWIMVWLAPEIATTSDQQNKKPIEREHH